MNQSIAETMTPIEAPECTSEPNVIPLSTFIADFGDGLLDAVSQSTSGDKSDTGLDVLNQDGGSIEVALARQLVG